MSKRYTEGIAFDGAAILDNGEPITITEILNRLNRLDDIENVSQKSSVLPSIISESEANGVCPRCKSEDFSTYTLWDIERRTCCQSHVIGADER